MSVRKDKNGAWMFVIDGPRSADGSRRQIVRRGFRTKKLATDAEDTARADAKQGLLPIQSNRTLKEYLETWIKDWAAANVSQRTREGYELLCGTYINPALGQVRLDYLTSIHIERFMRDLQTRPGARNPMGLSARTALHVYRCLHGALEQAVRWRLIPSNPASLVRPPRPARPSRSPLSAEEIERAIAAAAAYDRPRGTDYLMIVTVAIATGMRRCEICALHWQDVDDERGVIQVRQSVEVCRGQLALKAPKNGRPRGVRIGEGLCDMFRRRRPAPGMAVSDLVFCKEDGGIIHPDMITRAWEKIRALAGVTLHFHDLRHTQASLLGEHVEMKVISDRLGHSTIGITADLYTHLSTNAQAPAALLVDQVLTPIVERAEKGRNRVT